MAMDFCHFLASSSGVASGSFDCKEYKDFPYTFDHAYILGNKYSVIHDLEDIRAFIRSRLWFSYRCNFPPIGGTGPVTDKHWGCMLRCGQMVMAEAILRRHLGRDWIWDSSVQNPVYLKILSMFQDKKDSPYSIHQIAQMGVSEGKSIGQWFGPNTVAQVLRKLSVYDEWSNIAVHVALDNAVVIDDIKRICKHTAQQPTSRRLNHSAPIVKDLAENYINGVPKRKLKWRPMLLFVPLRLGLATLNPLYARGLKTTLTMKHSVGIIGGKPSHALWFIGYVGNELVYLDPHTTQPCVNIDMDQQVDDSSFHIPYGRSKRMRISEIDPSIALAFYFDSEEDFDQWCRLAQNLLIAPEKTPLFELSEKRPSHWPPLELVPDVNSSVCSSGEYYFVERDRRVDDSDEDFEIFDPIFPSHDMQKAEDSTEAPSRV